MTVCLNCEGWGCAQCQNEREEARGGEQGPTALELELATVTAQRDALAGIIDDLSDVVADAMNTACGFAWDAGAASVSAICLGCDAMVRREELQAHALKCTKHPVGALRVALEGLLDDSERIHAGHPLPLEVWFARRDFARAVLDGGAP